MQGTPITRELAHFSGTSKAEKRNQGSFGPWSATPRRPTDARARSGFAAGHTRRPTVVRPLGLRGIYSMYLHVPVALARHQALVLSVGITSAKTALADIATQHVAEQRGWGELDLRRAGIFGMYGLLYLGLMQHLLYTVVFPRLFPTAVTFAALPLAAQLHHREGQAAVLLQVALDQGVHWPFVAIPAFHLFKGFGERRD